MPPSMNGAPLNDTPELTKDNLSDEAIYLLYEIVRRAESSHDRSSRALFNAYEEILADNGLRPEDDGVLHRFLFRMQQGRKRDESLVERFKRVLGEIDIQVECNSDGEGIEVTTALDQATRHERKGAQNPLEKGHERRGSFDSFFDGSADKIAGPDTHELPLRPRRRSRGAGAASDAHLDRWAKRRSRSDTEAQSYHHAQLPIRARVNGHSSRRTASEQHTSNHRRSGSISSRGSLQIRRNGPSQTSHAGDYDADDSEYTERTVDLDLSQIEIPGVNAPIPDTRHGPLQQYAPEPYRPSDTRLMDDAAALEHQRLYTLARACLLRWRERTRTQLQWEAEMDRKAATFDRRRLLKKALDTVREEAHLRRANRETERFFARYERRAEKARDLFLLTKAFTHWAKSAGDEVQRTSVARRHILRTRFFNGWREITAVNELKIQHFVLRKFLALWRGRAASVRDQEILAIQVYERDLVHRVFKQWFFRYCDIAAPAWHDVHLKRLMFEKWHEITIILTARENWATDRKDRESLRRAMQSWSRRTTAVQLLEPHAEEFRRRALLENGLFTLRKQAQLVPLLAQLQGKVSLRIKHSALQAWRQNFQLSRQAINVDQLRIMRNAWTAWNDRLRIKALEERINDRVLVEALYRWTLASRVSLFQRVHDRNLKASVLLTWVTKTNERRNTLEGAERWFIQYKRAQLLRSALRRMEAQTAERRAEEFAVTAEYDAKLKQRVWDRLLDKHEHFQQLEKWAGDARFYMLTTRSLKTWNQATQLARRNRRRELYTHMRRTVKMNLVRRAFSAWKAKVDDISQKYYRAETFLQTHTIGTIAQVLKHWHTRTTALTTLSDQASQYHNTRLQTRYLQTWIEHLRKLQSMESKALALRQENTELAATAALKKLGWRVWNIQRQEENALALLQRNFEKHVRAMIRFWGEQAAERAAMRPVSPTPTSRSHRRVERDEDENGDEGHGGGGGDGDATNFGLGIDDQHNEEDGDVDDETRRLEAWTAFDSRLDLDLDLSLSPPPQPSSAAHPPLARPHTFPQPQSALRPPPPRPAPIPEAQDLTLDDPAAFWTSTPAVPPPPPPPPLLSGIRPGYLKTPSKRSVVRGRRPELPPSPEKRAVELNRAGGAMSAPPVTRVQGVETSGGREGRGGLSGVTSFERRLREGGFGVGVGVGVEGGSSTQKFSAAAAGRTGRVGGNARGRAKGRVGFGDVSEFG